MSLTLAQVRLLGIARAKDLIRVIAVNDAVYPCFFADVAYACDRKWWAFHRDIAGFRGIKVSLDLTGLPGVRQLENTGTEGFDPRPGRIRTGGNSAYQALHLAAHAGARRSILVAIDMQGEGHWFGDHPKEVRGGKQSYPKRLEEFADVAPIYADLGMDVVNVSSSSAIGAFRRSTIEAELQRLEIEHGEADRTGAAEGSAQAGAEARAQGAA